MLHRRHVIGGLALGAATLLSAPRARAQAASAAGDFVLQTAQAVGTALGSNDVDGNMARVLLERLDIDYAARFTLGRYWNALQPAERTDYERLFRAYAMQVYRDRFRRYYGGNWDVSQLFRVTGQPRVGERDIVVPTELSPPDGGLIRIEWRLRQEGQSFRVIDLAVENVSQALTTRQEFESVITQRGGNPRSIIQVLRERTGQS
jgi:phospholipid transport system substrate-binding protein